MSIGTLLFRRLKQEQSCIKHYFLKNLGVSPTSACFNMGLSHGFNWVGLRRRLLLRLGGSAAAHGGGGIAAEPATRQIEVWVWLSSLPENILYFSVLISTQIYHYWKYIIIFCWGLKQLEAFLADWRCGSWVVCPKKQGFKPVPTNQ